MRRRTFASRKDRSRLRTCCWTTASTPNAHDGSENLTALPNYTSSTAHQNNTRHMKIKIPSVLLNALLCNPITCKSKARPNEKRRWDGRSSASAMQHSHSVSEDYLINHTIEYGTAETNTVVSEPLITLADALKGSHRSSVRTPSINIVPVLDHVGTSLCSEDAAHAQDENFDSLMQQPTIRIVPDTAENSPTYFRAETGQDCNDAFSARPDRWSWTNSNAPSTPRLFCRGNRLAATSRSCPDFVRTWALAQSNHLSESLLRIPRSPTSRRVVLKNQAFKPNLLPSDVTNRVHPSRGQKDQTTNSKKTCSLQVTHEEPSIITT